MDILAWGPSYRAVEALGVVVVVEGLHPPVPGLDGEAAGNALGGEQLVPVWWPRVSQTTAPYS